MFFDAARPETVNSIALACRNNDVEMLKVLELISFIVCAIDHTNPITNF